MDTRANSKSRKRYASVFPSADVGQRHSSMAFRSRGSKSQLSVFRVAPLSSHHTKSPTQNLVFREGTIFTSPVSSQYRGLEHAKHNYLRSKTFLWYLAVFVDPILFVLGSSQSIDYAIPDAFGGYHQLIALSSCGNYQVHMQAHYFAIEGSSHFPIEGQQQESTQDMCKVLTWMVSWG